jgi:dipeptidyl aminopeptidase/acylaminoacyl peptidase
MNMLRWRILSGPILAAVLCAAPEALYAQKTAEQKPIDAAIATAKRPLAIEDLYLFDGPQAVTLAPQADFAVYVRQWIDAETKAERNSLWRVDAGGAKRPLEPGEPDGRSPVFSPDGRWIAIRSTRARREGEASIPPTPPQSDPATDIWLVPAEGGEAIPLCGAEKPYGRVFNDLFYGRVAFSPDGRKLVFVADDGRDPRTAEERAAGVEVVRPDQGEGYTGYGTAQIWVAQLASEPKRQAAERIERITDDDVWYGDPQWSPDGRWLVVHANRTADRESARYSINKNYDLWAIDASDHSLKQLTAGPGPEVSPRFSPDGRRLACLSSPRKGPHADVFNLALVDFVAAAGEGGSPQASKIVFDFHHRPEQPADDPAPTFPLPDECFLGADALIYTGFSGLQSATMRVDLQTGNRTAVVAPKSSDVASGGEYERRAARRRELTPPGNAFLKQRLQAESRRVEWTNAEGLQLDGVLTVPPESIAQPPYKLVLFPHGGPHSRSSQGFNFTSQIFAAHGYAVFEPNFRGSAGYGRKFLDADRKDFGGGDMRDIVSGIESLIARELVDPKRQFVYGVSYGGYMTCWLVGHTTQFRAAVAQNAVTDLHVMWGLSDIQSWTEWEFGGKPWEVAESMHVHSPLTYAADVVTPTLILHSRDDRRCPIPMGRMFYQSLLARGVPTVMVIYPDEGHGIRQPLHREDVLRRTLAWFAEHDK